MNATAASPKAFAVRLKELEPWGAVRTNDCRNLRNRREGLSGASGAILERVGTQTTN